jgi:pimeloyl-ACP methyl ester carboxylesterase
MSTRDDTIAITVGEENIAGTIVTLGTVVPGVLFLHGWGGSQNQYLARAREIAALGCVSLTVDFRGHAANEHQRETVSREDNLRDALAAYDALVARRPVDASRIAVVGSSYGGYLAAILTTLRPVKWLALRAPALYQDAGWDLPKQQLNKDPELKAYRRRQLPPQDNRALRACAEFKGDVLLVESEHDDLVPHPTIENYVEACKHAHSLTYRTIQGADHGLSTEPSQRAYTSLLVNWMTEMAFGAHETGVSAQGSARAQSAPQAAPKED